MKNNINKELQSMKFLFHYKPGVVLSEQVEDTEVDFEMTEEEEFDVPVMLPGTKEKERTITIPGTKPGEKTKTPYRPKPGPKKNPKADKDHMPDWLTFDELGIDFE